MAVVLGPGVGTLTASDGTKYKFDVGALEINWFKKPVKLAAPLQRWCRFCGGETNGPEIWRMSCDECWEQASPSTYQIAAMYGSFVLSSHQKKMATIISSA